MTHEITPEEVYDGWYASEYITFEIMDYEIEDETLRLRQRQVIPVFDENSYHEEYGKEVTVTSTLGEEQGRQTLIINNQLTYYSVSEEEYDSFRRFSPNP